MRKYAIIILMLLALIIITTPTRAAECPEYQDTAISAVIGGELFVYCNDTQAFESFGDIIGFNRWLNDGVYIIYFNGNFLEDEQEINKIYSPIQGKWVN